MRRDRSATFYFGEPANVPSECSSHPGTDLTGGAWGKYSSGHMRRKVLFLCIGNSARSQMAEAIVNARLSQEWEGFSAGTRPAGHVHPLALQALCEIGIEHQGRSKPADEFRAKPFDLVVTVCDAAAETCPVWLGRGRRAHLGFRDPAAVEGSEEEVLAAFRAVRDEIAGKVPALLREHMPDTAQH